MRYSALILVCAWLLTGAYGSERHECDYGQALPFHVQIDHPWAGVLGEPFPVQITLRPRDRSDFTCRGRLLGDDGKLLVSGAWDLVLEEISGGEVIASRSLRPAVEGKAGTMIISASTAQGSYTWDAKDCFAHRGNYRLRLAYGGVGRTGDLFRVDTTQEPPLWISVGALPDQTRAMLGAPIGVDFIVANHGRDDFHVRFGGDYRGASRAQKFHFTAVRSDGAPAWDPEPRQVCFGGLGRAGDLRPGESEHQVVMLGAYLRFPGPGTYTVTAYHNLEFGAPLLQTDNGTYAKAGNFTLILDPPTPEGIARVVAAALSSDRWEDSWPLLAHLHEPSFLPALREALTSGTALERVLAVVDGIASIDTPEATHVLISCVADPRPRVQERALICLRERAPRPAAGHSQQVLMNDALQDARAALTWDAAGQRLIEAALPALLGSSDPQVRGAAIDLAGVVGGDGCVEIIAAVADRLASGGNAPDGGLSGLGNLQNAGFQLGRAQRAPCLVCADSSPGRMILWARMMEGRGAAASPEQEGLLMVMLASPCSGVRHAALVAFTDEALRRLPIPWRDLFGDDTDRGWWTALKRSRAVPLAVMRPIVDACPQAGWDEWKIREFAREIAMRLEHEGP